MAALALVEASHGLVAAELVMAAMAEAELVRVVVCECSSAYWKLPVGIAADERCADWEQGQWGATASTGGRPYGDEQWPTQVGSGGGWTQRGYAIRHMQTGSVCLAPGVPELDCDWIRVQNESHAAQLYDSEGFEGAGRGGGAIQLHATRVEIASGGVVSANGGSARAPKAGGGSGGSIAISSVELVVESGASISVNGGAGLHQQAGGGAGGRIALRYVVGDVNREAVTAERSPSNHGGAAR